jgi:predicted SprT family Zn-dependent metalloprotease
MERRAWFPSPTTDTYGDLVTAYDHYNRHLFAGRLPPCLITLQRTRHAYGYFSPARYRRRGTASYDAWIFDEIALNPDKLEHRPIDEALSTLVHEMVHLEQAHFGFPASTPWHNQEWAQWMERVGLVPSETGKPGGKRTGRQCSHYIELGGLFARVTAEFLLTHTDFRLPFDTVGDRVRRGGVGVPSKLKYTCPECRQNAWAKPEALLLCGYCDGRKMLKEQ